MIGAAASMKDEPQIKFEADDTNNKLPASKR